MKLHLTRLTTSWASWLLLGGLAGTMLFWP
jgi:hypothetical protein